MLTIPLFNPREGTKATPTAARRQKHYGRQFAIPILKGELTESLKWCKKAICTGAAVFEAAPTSRLAIFSRETASIMQLKISSSDWEFEGRFNHIQPFVKIDQKIRHKITRTLLSVLMCIFVPSSTGRSVQLRMLHVALAPTVSKTEQSKSN